jgi:putative FmdB family regulatory protein
MPVYEYACKSCGHHLEVSQSFKDPPLTDCPVCGGPLRKVFNSIGIVLKGSGFYRTDSRTPAKKAETSEAGAKGDKGDKGDKGGDKGGDKSAAKSDAKSESASSASEGKAAGGTTAKSA